MLQRLSPSWESIERSYGGRLVADARRAAAQNAGDDGEAVASIGIRHFLIWAAGQTSASAGTLVSALSGRRPEALSDAQYTQLVTAAVKNWIAEIDAAGTITAITLAHYAARAGAALEALGSIDPSRYPPFRKRFVSVQKAVGDVVQIGELDWPETKGMTGAARDRAALALVQAAAFRQFSELEKVHAFGRSVLAGDAPPGTDAGARALIRGLLATEREAWLTIGRSRFSGNVADGVDARLTRIETWRAAGLPDDVLAHFKTRNRGGLPTSSIATLAMACLGPTRRAAVAVMVAFCCGTGWNRQPIADLPRNPFLFVTRNDCGVATSAFVESFKKRAGHDVLAYLERQGQARGLAEEAIRATWRETADNIDPMGGEGGYAVLSRTGASADLISLLERFSAMADSIRAFDRDGTHADRLFLYLTQNFGVFRKDSNVISECFDDEVLSRPGVTYRAIRKSHLALKLREVGTVSAVRPLAGHAGTGVLMPHYLNSAEIRQELDLSIRFFQNACQALIVRGTETAALRLDLSPEHLEWFSRLAAFAGISAAVGAAPNPAAAPAGGSHLRFDPTPENLRDLYLTHLALRRYQAVAPRTRWRVQGLPLLGAVKAIGRTLCRKGLRKAYVTAAREAQRALLAGAVALPPVMED